MDGELDKKPFKELRANLNGKNRIRGGSVKRVYADPQEPEKRVVTVEKYWIRTNNPERRIFLSHYILIKIANLLYPNVVPDAYKVSSRKRLLVRERIHGQQFSAWTSLLHELGIRTEKSRVETKAMDEVGEVLRDLGLNTDFNPSNFIQDPNNHTYYVDTLSENVSTEETAKRIESAISGRLTGLGNDVKRREALKWLGYYRKFTSIK